MKQQVIDTLIESQSEIKEIVIRVNARYKKEFSNIDPVFTDDIDLTRKQQIKWAIAAYLNVHKGLPQDVVLEVLDGINVDDYVAV